MVTYIVPAHSYSAPTQGDADALAQADVAANGQNYANTNGTCTTGVTMVPVSYANMTTLAAGVSRVKFKDAGGNVIYDFTEVQLKAGVSVAAGNYTIEVSTYGTPYNTSTQKGWNSFEFDIVRPANVYHFQDNTGGNPATYVMPDGNLTQATQVYLSIYTDFI